MLKIAMLSKWHVHAAGYADEALSTGKVEITAVWDEDASRGAEWAKELGCQFEKYLDNLINRKDVDAVICCAPTTMHEDILIKAANAGKHIFTEKALAPTVEGCKNIAKAINESGVTFAISHPNRFRGEVKYILDTIKSGKLGKITTARIRNAHNGLSGNWLPEYWFEEKDAAGGAMMDLGCHGMYLLSAICGKPKRISAIFNSPLGSAVDENAVSVIEFENGCIGISETGFDSSDSPFMLEVYGTDGCIQANNWNITIKNKETKEISNMPIVPKTQSCDASPIYKFIDACINGTGTPDGLGLDDAIALTELLEISYISNKTNTTVMIP